jgi:predicted deacylase
MSEILDIAGHKVHRGERIRFEIPLPSLANNSEVGMPVEIIRGLKDGPTLLLTAAIHGDELNGVEAIHRILKSKLLNELSGTLICVPIVNVYGFNSKSRYLPDRRDLNRCFPGKNDGSLGSRIAFEVMKLARQSTHVIDLHTGSIHRSNIPQIRAALTDAKIKHLAKSFGAPVIINSNLRDGSFRESLNDCKIPVLLFEGGQALRFEEPIIKGIVKGVFEVMHVIGMIKTKRAAKSSCVVAQKTYWVRTSESGVLKLKKPLGAVVKKGDTLAVITDPFGKIIEQVITFYDGVILGCVNLPTILAGEAAFHIGLFEDADDVEEYLESYDLQF